jgi:hypothetical protein
VTERRPEAWALYREAFAIALRCDDAELVYDIATQVLGWGAAPGREKERYELFLEALQHRRTVSGQTIGRFGLYEGWAHLDHGDHERCWPAWQSLADLAQRTHSAYLAPFVARTELVTALIRGEFAAALDAADRLAAQTAGASVALVGRILGSSVVHRALLHLGRPAEALARLDDVMRS